MPNPRVLVVEDEKIYVKYLQLYLEDSGYDIAGCFDNAKDAINFLKENTVDVGLLDIMIKGEHDGIELAKHINENYDFPVIYTSSMTDTETIGRAKVTRPAAYLVKPFEDQDLLITLEMAMFNHKQKEEPAEVEEGAEETDIKEEDLSNHYLLDNRIFIKDKFRFERVYFSDITHLSAEGNYVKVFTKGKQYVLAVTLGTLHDKINDNKFLRVHRSYVVNLEEIEALEGNRMFIGDNEIPIGRNYREEVQQYFNMI